MVLSLGSKGELVTALQQALIKHGFILKADGDFGPTTERVVKEFQRKALIVDDGVAGKVTLAMLGISPNFKPKSADNSKPSGSTKFAKLSGVHPDLIKVVERAAEITEMPFIGIEGVRTLARQQQLVKSKASKTMKSKHLVQATGYGHAVDIAPYFDMNGDGKHEVSWHWEHFYPVAEAMRQAAKELNIRVRWGGCWVFLNDTDSTVSTKKLVEMYYARKRAEGKTAFPDGPHYELG